MLTSSLDNRERNQGADRRESGRSQHDQAKAKNKRFVLRKSFPTTGGSLSDTDAELSEFTGKSTGN